MKTTTKPCTNGPRHSWKWVSNTKTGTITVSALGTCGHFSLRGVYSCACGQKKLGQPNMNCGAADLRSL